MRKYPTTKKWSWYDDSRDKWMLEQYQDMLTGVFSRAIRVDIYEPEAEYTQSPTSLNVLASFFGDAMQVRKIGLGKL